MGLEHAYHYGQTPLSIEEQHELVPKHLTTLNELNEWEQENILEATKWLHSKKIKTILTISFIQKLHRRMFQKTWKWAGRFRLSDKNIGVSSFQIVPQLKAFLDDIKYWDENNIFNSIEFGARVHHRLVCIHPFANGNGRHARLFVDTLMQQKDLDRFTWGLHLKASPQEIRRDYINSLQQADSHNFAPLIQFVMRNP